VHAADTQRQAVLVDGEAIAKALAVPFLRAVHIRQPLRRCRRSRSCRPASTTYPQRNRVRDAGSAHSRKRSARRFHPPFICRYRRPTERPESPCTQFRAEVPISRCWHRHRGMRGNGSTKRSARPQTRQHTFTARRVAGQVWPQKTTGCSPRQIAHGPPPALRVCELVCIPRRGSLLRAIGRGVALFRGPRRALYLVRMARVEYENGSITPPPA